jgi:hypothetical protein
LRLLRSRLAGERGQSLIEFVFVIPFVLFMLLAMVDFGVALDRRMVLQHGLREGARFAAVGGDAFSTGTVATESDVKAYTEAQSQGIADADGALGSDSYIEVCYEDDNGNGDLGDMGDNVVVRVHYLHDFFTGFSGLVDSSFANIGMDPSASARVEKEVSWAEECGPWPP